MDAADLHMDDVVVDMQEEEGQRHALDEQQHDGDVENVNVDEQEDAAAEEREGEGEDVVAAQNEVIRISQQKFGLACGRIQRNDPSFTSFCPTIELNDFRAVQLGRALIGNTELTTLNVSFFDDTEFTSRGARALVAGVSGSQITCLSLNGEHTLPMEMSQLWARSIEKLSLMFPFRNKFANQLCHCLTANNLLQHLSIDVYGMTPRVAQILSTFLCAARSITSLEVSAYIAHPPTIQTLYLEGIHQSQHIQNLSFQGHVGDMHLLIPMLPKLQSLIITNAYLSLAEVKLLARGLRNPNQLYFLSLFECELCPEHMSVLLPVLGNHPSIKVMELGNNELGDAGVTSFVKHWQPESTIEKLALSNNEISPKGAALLITASANHPALHLLNLFYNRLVGFDGLKLIGKALPNAKLQTLDIVNMVCWIEYDDDACEAAVIQEAKRTAAGKALLEGVRANGHLLEMRLGESHLPMNVVEEIDLYIKANALGRPAALENQHALPSGVWSHFFVKEGMSSSLLFLFLRELPGVVMGGSCSSTIGRKRRRALSTSHLTHN